MRESYQSAGDSCKRWKDYQQKFLQEIEDEAATRRLDFYTALFSAFFILYMFIQVLAFFLKGGLHG